MIHIRKAELQRILFFTAALVGLVSFVLLRPDPPIYPYTDLSRYYVHFRSSAGASFAQANYNSRYETGYAALAFVMAHMGLSFYSYLTFVKLAVVSAYWKASSMFLDGLAFPVLATVLFMISPLFVNYTENVVRQGLAIPIAYLAVAMASRRRFLGSGAWLLAALSFHGSSIAVVPVIGLIYMRIARYLRVAFIVFLISLALYATNIWLVLGQYVSILVGLIVPGYGAYASDSSGYVTGFKLTFTALTAVGGLFSFAIYTIGRRNPINVSPSDSNLIFFYLVTSSFYMALSSYAFYDRVAAISWCLVPVLGARTLQVMFRPLSSRREDASVLGKNFG